MDHGSREIHMIGLIFIRWFAIKCHPRPKLNYHSSINFKIWLRLIWVKLTRHEPMHVIAVGGGCLIITTKVCLITDFSVEPLFIVLPSMVLSCYTVRLNPEGGNPWCPGTDCRHRDIVRGRSQELGGMVVPRYRASGRWWWGRFMQANKGLALKDQSINYHAMGRGAMSLLEKFGSFECFVKVSLIVHFLRRWDPILRKGYLEFMHEKTVNKKGT